MGKHSFKEPVYPRGMPNRATVIGAGAMTGAVLMIAGVIVWGDPGVPDTVATITASETTAPPTYQGIYPGFNAPSVIMVSPMPVPGDKDAPVAPSSVATSSSIAPTTTTEVPPSSETTVAPPAEPIEPPVVAPPAPPAVLEAPMTGGACSDSGYNGVKPFVARVGHHVQNRFDIATVGGVAGRNRNSDHPNGLALDFMVSTGGTRAGGANEAKGDEVARYLLDNKDAFDVRYVIWKQRINYGRGWVDMQDRGSNTENHYDHVHASFISDGDAAPSC